MSGEDLLTTTTGFAEQVLELPLYDWQAKALIPLEKATGKKAQRQNISVVAPNGSGKDDRIIPGAALWWLCMHAQGTVVITSKSDLQLSQQTIPSLDRYWRKLGWEKPVLSPHYEMKTPTGGRLIAFVTNNAGRVEGWHKKDDIYGPLLLIINETAEVDDPILQAFDRCTPNAVMYLSKPGLMMGRFYDTHTKYRASWTCIQAGLADCPHIPKERIDFILEHYGEEHPFTRSTLYGEFMEQDEANKFVVSLSSLERCISNPPPYRPGIRVAFCDFAAGGDENVIALRDGNRITLEAHWREKDKRAAVYRFIQEFRRLKLKGPDIWGDAAAKDMIDMLYASGWEINRKNFGDRNCQDIYISWGAQAWLELAISIEKCEVTLPTDDTLKAQLTSRMKKPSSTGKQGIEEKWFMAKRNIPSPDRADAVAGCWGVFPPETITKTGIDLNEFQDRFEFADFKEDMEEIGAWAGGG